MCKILLVGRHEADLPGYEVVDRIAVTWSVKADEVDRQRTPPQQALSQLEPHDPAKLRQPVPGHDSSFLPLIRYW